MSTSTRNPIHEPRHRFDDRFRLIPMHRMAAIRELEQLDIACPTCDARELLHRLILVVFAPHSEDGDANARQDSSMFHWRNSESSQIRLQPQNAESTSR